MRRSRRFSVIISFCLIKILFILVFALLKLFVPSGYDGLPLNFKKDVNKTCTIRFITLPWRYTEKNNYFTIFLIKSAVKFSKRRASIRKTWGSIASIDGKKFGAIFLVGSALTSRDQEFLERENEMFGDILQSNVSDAYKSLPKKVLSGFKFLSERSYLKTVFVASTDDDCFVNIPQFYDYFSWNQSSKLNGIHCGWVYNDKETPIRDPKSKWHVPTSMYPKDYFPPLCHGGLVILSVRHVRKLYGTSLHTEYGDFPLEDVLIFGILRQKTEDSFHDKSFRVSRINERAKLRFPKQKLVHHLHFSTDISNDMRKRWITSLSILKVDNSTTNNFKTKLDYLLNSNT